MNIEEYDTRNPKGNYEYFNNLNNNSKEIYLELVKKYYNLVLEFLDREYNLKKIDDKFVNSPLRYKEVELDDCDIYQSLSKKKYKFFYLRSNIYIERLSKEELEYLNGLEKYDDSTNSFIKSTIMKVATEAGVSNNIYTTNYGPDSTNYFARSDEVIIGFREDEFYKYPDQTSEKWNELNDKKKYDTRKNFNDLEFELYNNDGIKFKVIEYNSFSVVPKQKIEVLKI